MGRVKGYKDAHEYCCHLGSGRNQYSDGDRARDLPTRCAEEPPLVGRILKGEDTGSMAFECRLQSKGNLVPDLGRISVGVVL